MQLILFLIVNSLAVFIASRILPGIQIDNLTTIIIVAIVLGILNTFVKPILKLLTLPISIITLGLFVLVIDAVLVLLASAIVPGFHVDGFLWALAFSLVLSIVSGILNSLVKN